MDNKKRILQMKPGQSIDWKFGLCTRDVYRIDDNTFEITDTSNGWVNATVNIEMMTALLDGRLSLTELNWK